jgi:hypothetical protein
MATGVDYPMAIKTAMKAVPNTVLCVTEGTMMQQHLKQEISTVFT